MIGHDGEQRSPAAELKNRLAILRDCNRAFMHCEPRSGWEYEIRRDALIKWNNSYYELWEATRHWKENQDRTR